MATEPKRVAVEPGSELARLLDEASRTPLLFEMGGVTFRLATESSPRSADYNPRAAVAAMRAAAGSWKDIDPQAFKEFLYRSREEGTKPEKPA